MAVNSFPGNLRIGVLNETVPVSPAHAPCPIDPKFQVMVLLSGYQKFTVDDRKFVLDAREGPVAIMMHLRRAGVLSYKTSFGTPYRKVALATPSAWLNQLVSQGESLPPGLEETDEKLSAHIWRPDTEAIRLTSQIITPPPQQSPVQTELFRMSRGLELIRRVLATRPIAVDDPERSAHPIAEKIRLYILDNIDKSLHLEQLERDLGMNRRSIQRHFKTGTGQTLSDYMRRQRLSRARRALSEDGISIAQAAHLAGYSTPENFATAFRNLFGMPPQHLRNGAF